MKAKIVFSILMLLTLIASAPHVQAQLTSPADNGQTGPVAPFDEGGGTHSTSWQNNANGLHVNGFTKIGIGTMLPQLKLDIFGTANTMMRITSEGGANLGSHVAGIEFKRVINGGSEVKWDIVNQNALRIRHSGIPVVSFKTDEALFGNLGERMVLDIWGKSMVPYSGSFAGGAITIRDFAGGSYQKLSMDADEINANQGLHLNRRTTANISLALGGGNVSVNTSDEEAKINVSSESNMQLKLINSGPDGASWRIGASNSNWMSGAGKLVFSKSTGSADAVMVMTEAGNVGIGLNTPSKTLHVNGTTSTKVLEVTGGADLAEPFAINVEREVVLPGMVVSIDTENAGALVISGKSYDKTVAGIVSGAGDIQPGMIMGQEGTIANGKHPVALTGRVYCRVDARYGAIRPGDLLTTSDTPGHAMKVSDHNHAQGAIIGKAMTSLDEGQGLVLVLVSLQ